MLSIPHLPDYACVFEELFKGQGHLALGPVS